MAQARRRSGGGATIEVTVERIGGRGDGITDYRGRPVYVPFTVPGDRVRARLEGRRGDGQAASLVEILTPGPSRQAPACQHFGTCGGCALQHLDEAAYHEWIRDRVSGALERQRLRDVVVAPVIPAAPGSRRRATLAARATASGTVLGFRERRQHRIVDLRVCPVLRPELAAILPPLRDMLGRILRPGESAEIALTALESGIDATIAASADPDLAARETLAAFAESADLARLSWKTGKASAEPVAQRRPCTIVFGGVPVSVPSGAFLQASRDGEAALVRLVTDAAGRAGRVADLFAGLGTFGFPLAKTASVHAIDSDGEALDALRAAVNRAGMTSRLAVEDRNLFRDPLTADELSGFDAAVFDPPRAGAAAQAEQLAGSGVSLVVGVSCNPVSFARDAATLVGGGYRLEGVTPVDQFLWSEHIELVGVFRRP